MLIMSSLQKSLIAEQFEGNYLKINQVVGKRWGRYIFNWGGGGEGRGEGGQGFSGKSHHKNWESFFFLACVNQKIYHN